MAWPDTPLTTYVAGTTPSIKAFDLNAIQSAINDIYTGATTLKGLKLTLSVNIAGTSTPTPTPVAGTLYKDTILFASLLTKTSGTALQSGVNISAYSYSGSTGIFNATLINPVTNINNAIAFAQFWDSPSTAGAQVQAFFTTTTNMQIRQYNAVAALANIGNVQVAVYNT